MLPYIHIWAKDIPCYGLFMVSGIIIAVFISYKRLKKRGENLDSLLLVVSISMLFALSCAAFAYIFFSYGVRRLFLEIASGDFSAFENIGLVYYGGLIGGLTGALFAIRINKYEFTIYSDAIVPTIPLGHAFGRIGCLFGGCCYGLPYDGPLAVHSVYAGQGISLFPIQAVEAGINCFLFFALAYYADWSSNRKHNTLVMYLLLYSVERFILEFFRGDTIRGIFNDLSSSQWISIAIFLGLLIKFAIKYLGIISCQEMRGREIP